MIASDMTHHASNGGDSIEAHMDGGNLTVAIRADSWNQRLAFYGPPDEVIDTLQRLLEAAHKAVGKPEAEMA